MHNEVHSKFADLLKNSDDSLFSLLSLFKDTLIFILDSSGRFTFGHSDSNSRLHTAPGNFLGKTVPEVLPEHISIQFEKAFEMNREGEVTEIHYWMDMVTHIGWFSASCTPIFRNGVFEGTIAIVRDVTREKEASEALKTSEENYRTLVETAAMAIVIIENNRVVYTNPVTTEISGYTVEELIGQDFLDFIAPSERERVSEIHTRRLEGLDAPEVYELKMLKKSGKLIDVEISAKTITFQGKPSTQVIMQDITLRKQAERELLSIQETLREKVAERTRELERYRAHLEEIVDERTGRLHDTISLLQTEIDERMQAEERIEHLNLILKAIRNINQLITSETDPERLIWGACRSLVETRGYKDAWIVLLNRDGSFLTASEARYGEDLKPLEEYIVSGETTPCMDRSLKGGDSWISDEARSVCVQCPLKQDTSESRRIMGCRLECRGRVYGVLTVTSLGENPPDTEEVTLFKEVCDDIAFALDSLEQEKAKEQATRALAESQNRYETLFENATAAIMFLDGEAIIECNSICAEMFGASPDEMAGLSPWEISPPRQPDGRSSEEAARKYVTSAIRSGPQYFRWIHKRKNGESFPAEVGLNAVSINGKDYIQAVLMDITTRENAENALRESERNYRTLYTNVPVGLFRSRSTDRGTLVEANPTMAAMFGFASPDELIKIHTEELFASVEDRKKYLEIIREKHLVRDFSVEMKRRDDSRFWASISARSFSSADNGEMLVDGIIKDISETIRYENNLKKSVESLQKAIDGTVSAMSLLVEMKDPYTSGHQRGVSHLARSIAVEMGLSQERIDCIRIASTLHDLGKLSIPTEILSKPGPLSEYEVSFLKTHPKAGYDILGAIEFPWPIADVILQHHERLDGSGYPYGLRENEIMLEARILAVADVVEATASRRPYRASRGVEVAMEAIKNGSGTLFDPDVVKACLSLFTEHGYALIDHDSQIVDPDFAI